MDTTKTLTSPQLSSNLNENLNNVHTNESYEVNRITEFEKIYNINYQKQKSNLMIQQVKNENIKTGEVKAPPMSKNRKNMRKLLLASAVSLLVSTTADAEDIKLGIIFGFTGPIESLTPDMAKGAEAAIAEVSASGALLSLIHI